MPDFILFRFAHRHTIFILISRLFMRILIIPIMSALSNVLQESELHSLEADLALQRQICEAARRLSLEEHISKPVRKNRLQQCKREEKKVKELQEAVLKHSINHGCVSPKMCSSSKQRGMSYLLLLLLWLLFLLSIHPSIIFTA